jgi:hypothetical protein
MAENKTSDAEQRAQRAFDANVPQLYFNGFTNSATQADVFTVLERNGQPVAILNMSYTVAKTFAVSMNRIIAQFEEATGRSMLTTHEAEKALSEKAKLEQMK